MTRFPRSPLVAALAATLALVAALGVLAGCGGDRDAAAERPTIVVTTPILGAVVRELVGDDARVEVLMPNGVDPHDFQPSAKDASRLQDAALVVANGLELEESLEDPIEEARSAGVPVFTAGDHVEVRTFGEAELPAEDGEASGEHGEGTGADDPHLWMDPEQMARVVAAMAPAVRDATGLDVAARAEDLVGRLTALDAELAARAAAIPAARRKLVTGHESMGYFARAYGFTLIGAIVPSLSSQAEPSAGDLADLRAQIRAEGVPAVFAEVGTPKDIAEEVAEETGVPVIEIVSHALPEDGSYLTFMREVMSRVEEGLGA